MRYFAKTVKFHAMLTSSGVLVMMCGLLGATQHEQRNVEVAEVIEVVEDQGDPKQAPPSPKRKDVEPASPATEDLEPSDPPMPKGYTASAAAVGRVTKVGDTIRMGCAEGGCAQKCPAKSQCTMSCSGKGCRQACSEGSSCTMACAGGHCRQSCPRGSSHCDLDCSGGWCNQICDETCNKKCVGRGCRDSSAAR